MAPVSGRIRSAYQMAELPFAPHTKEQFEKESQDPNEFKARRARFMLEAYAERREPPQTRLPRPGRPLRQGLHLRRPGGEVVIDYALWVQRVFPGERLMVAGYSNDVPCYIPSARVLREGGYEAVDSMIYYGQPGPFTKEAEPRIQEAVQEVMARGQKVIAALALAILLADSSDPASVLERAHAAPPEIAAKVLLSLEQAPTLSLIAPSGWRSSKSPSIWRLRHATHTRWPCAPPPTPPYSEAARLLGSQPGASGRPRPASPRGASDDGPEPPPGPRIGPSDAHPFASPRLQGQHGGARPRVLRPRPPNRPTRLFHQREDRRTSSPVPLPESCRHPRRPSRFRPLSQWCARSRVHLKRSPPSSRPSPQRCVRRNPTRVGSSARRQRVERWRRCIRRLRAGGQVAPCRRLEAYRFYLMTQWNGEACPDLPPAHGLLVFNDTLRRDVGLEKEVPPIDPRTFSPKRSEDQAANQTSVKRASRANSLRNWPGSAGPWSGPAPSRKRDSPPLCTASRPGNLRTESPRTRIFK